jgi:membrane protease YdiL (CAAX protease family)
MWREIVVTSSVIDRADLGDVPAANELSAGRRLAVAILCLAGGIAALAARSIPDQATEIAYGVVLAAFLLGLTLLVKRSSSPPLYWQLPFALFVFAVVQVLNNSIPSFVLTSVLHEHAVDGNPLASTVSGTVVVQLVEALIAIVPIVVLVRMAGLSLGSIYARVGRFGSAYVIAIIAFVGIYAVIGLSPTAHRFIPIQGTMTVSRYLALSPALLIMVISNGFEEELLFRGLFLQRYGAFFGVWGANILQALVFAFAHLGVSYTPNALLFILVAVFPLGLVGGFLMRRSDGVVAPALLHAALDIPIYLAFLTFVS